jgi:hypothetical protein
LNSSIHPIVSANPWANLGLFRSCKLQDIEPDIRVKGRSSCKLAAYVIPRDPANPRFPVKLGTLFVVQFKVYSDQVVTLKGVLTGGAQAETIE